MNKEKELKKLKIVTQRIVENYDPEKIILFGSYAWGKPNKDSDFDIFVVKKTKNSYAIQHGRKRTIRYCR